MSTIFKIFCYAMALYAFVLITFYLFKFLPRMEELKRLEKSAKHVNEQNDKIAVIAADCAQDRVETAAAFSEQLIEQQNLMLEMQKRHDERVAELQREADRQRANAEFWASKFDEYRRKVAGGYAEQPKEVRGDAA